MLAFDHDSHTYTWNGKVVPSVTQLLEYMRFSPDYSMVDPDVLAAAANRGTRIHKGIELSILGKEHGVELDKDQVEGIENFEGFCKKYHFTPLVPERQMYSEKYMFAGTCDLEGEMDGELWLIDFKTSWSLSPWVLFQLEAYRVLRNEYVKEAKPISKVGALHLPKTGGFRFYPEHELTKMAGGITDAKLRFLWGVNNYHWYKRYMKDEARDQRYQLTYD